MKEEDINKIVTLAKSRMKDKYFITEDGMFDQCESVDEMITLLMVVFDKCLNDRLERDSYCIEVIRDACINSDLLAEKIVKSNIEIDENHQVFDLIAESIFTR